MHLQWVTSEIQGFESYHNHKETMAWVATAFYITGVITFGFTLAYSPIPLFVNILASFGVLVTFFLAGVFINMQFRMRWKASDIQIGLTHYASRLCCNLEVPPEEPLFTQKDTFPDHVWQFIKQEQENRCRMSYRKAVITLFRRPHTLDERWRTELPSYILMILATVTSIISLWV